MPEGGALRRLAGRINERFAGQRVLRSATRDPRIATGFPRLCSWMRTPTASTCSCASTTDARCTLTCC